MSSDKKEETNQLGNPVPTSSDELGSRIFQVLALYPDRKTAAMVAGKSVDQLLAYAKGTSSPPWMVLVKLAMGVGVSLDWLATGKGAMRLDDLVATIRPAGPENRRGVPIFDAALSLGPGVLNGDAHPIGMLDLPDSYLRDALHCRPEKAVAVYMTGLSMSPTLQDGDLAIINTAARVVDRDGIYAFSLDGEGYIKRLQRTGAKIVVHSDNAAYKDWDIEGPQLATLHVIGRVAGVINRA